MEVRAITAAKLVRMREVIFSRELFADGKLLVVDSLELGEIKAKAMRQALEALHVEGTALLVDGRVVEPSPQAFVSALGAGSPAEAADRLAARAS